MTFHAASVENHGPIRSRRQWIARDQVALYLSLQAANSQLVIHMNTYIAGVASVVRCSTKYPAASCCALNAKMIAFNLVGTFVGTF
jgi:hypothetical protein